MLCWRQSIKVPRLCRATIAFNVDFVGWTKSRSALVVSLHACDADGEVRIPRLGDVDWTRPVGLVYNSPDDARIVRTRISGAPTAHNPHK
jgi:hypothetical protein